MRVFEIEVVAGTSGNEFPGQCGLAALPQPEQCDDQAAPQRAVRTRLMPVGERSCPRLYTMKIQHTTLELHGSILPAGDRADDPKCLFAGGHRIRQWRVRRLVGQVFLAGEEANHGPALERTVV